MMRITKKKTACQRADRHSIRGTPRTEALRTHFPSFQLKPPVFLNFLKSSLTLGHGNQAASPMFIQPVQPSANGQDSEMKNAVVILNLIGIEVDLLE